MNKEKWKELLFEMDDRIVQEAIYGFTSLADYEDLINYSKQPKLITKITHDDIIKSNCGHWVPPYSPVLNFKNTIKAYATDGSCRKPYTCKLCGQKVIHTSLMTLVGIMYREYLPLYIKERILKGLINNPYIMNNEVPRYELTENNIDKNIYDIIEKYIKNTGKYGEFIAIDLESIDKDTKKNNPGD